VTVDERSGRAGQRRARSNTAATRRGEVRRRTAATALNINTVGRAGRAASAASLDCAAWGLVRCTQGRGEGARGLHVGGSGLAAQGDDDNSRHELLAADAAAGQGTAQGSRAVRFWERRGRLFL
jgi:hypothetical protein